MKSLLINTHDISGGAAIAAHRIHKGLQGIGMDSKMLVQSKLSDDKTVIGSDNKIKKGFAKLRPTLEALKQSFPLPGFLFQVFLPGLSPLHRI